MDLSALVITILSLFLCVRTGKQEDRHHPRVKRRIETLPKEELESFFWNEKAQETLRERLVHSLNRNIARNIILFLGDGLSIPTITATRIYKGHLNGLPGEEIPLYFENFPYTGLSRTYCVDGQVADSACSATAYLGGVKGNTGTIGVTASVMRQNCNASRDHFNQVESIAGWAQKAGKATGLVTTTRVTHASPAGVYAHVAERGWEDDVAVLSDGNKPESCPDIAQQLIQGETGSRLNVILGGGRKNFYPDNMKDPRGSQGKRRDKKNLINMWKEQKKKMNSTNAYITSRSELLAVSPSVDYLLGLFSSCHLSYHLEGNKEEPTLEEMTVAAIRNLKKSPSGFFLFVEGGRIDHAHHDNMAKKSLDETLEFAKAVAAADSETSEDDTLIVVTADHSHVMTLSGYARRGNSVLGFAGEASDGLPYSTLSYANGPGYVQPERGSKRQDLRKVNREHKLYKFPSMIPLSTETHGGDDVAVFAKGPWSHLLTGSFEQNFIPHAMGYAACIGPGLTVCDSTLIT